MFIWHLQICFFKNQDSKGVLIFFEIIICNHIIKTDKGNTTLSHFHSITDNWYFNVCIAEMNTIVPGFQQSSSQSALHQALSCYWRRISWRRVPLALVDALKSMLLVRQVDSLSGWFAKLRLHWVETSPTGATVTSYRKIIISIQWS